MIYVVAAVVDTGQSKMELETERLILRAFREEDLDLLMQLMADAEFMRSSLGVYTLDQTAGLLDKIIGWERAGKPPLLAVELKPERSLLGYCGFLHHPAELSGEVPCIARIAIAVLSRKLRAPCATTRFTNSK